MEAREVEPAVMAGLRWLLSGLGLDCCRALRGGGRGHDLNPMKCTAYEQWLIRNEFLDLPPYEVWLWTEWLVLA